MCTFLPIFPEFFLFDFCIYLFKNQRSMFPRPRYHAQKRWAGGRGNEIRLIAGALAHLLEEEKMQNEWRWARSSPFPKAPYAQQRMPYFYGDPRCEGPWPNRPPRSCPSDQRPFMLPRRGPPVAARKEPRRYRYERWEERRPHGRNPGGPLRGGPERPADDPRRTPDAVCAEAPKGQPRNHRRRPKRLVLRPTGEKEEG